MPLSLRLCCHLQPPIDHLDHGRRDVSSDKASPNQPSCEAGVAIFHFQLTESTEEGETFLPVGRTKSWLPSQTKSPAMTDQLSFAQVCARAVGIEVSIYVTIPIKVDSLIDPIIDRPGARALHDQGACSCSRD